MRHIAPASQAVLLVPVVQALSVGAISCSYYLARGGSNMSAPFYWSGQLALLIPAVYVIARYRASAGTLSVCVLSTGLCSFLVMVAYQPLYLSFADEFQHHQTLQSVLSTGHLFAANTALPVSSVYPGLEVVTSGLAQLGHLPAYVAEMCIAGAAHIATLFLVFGILTSMTSSPRWAAIGSLAYTLNPQYQFIDSYFTYTVFGLLFTFAAVLCLVLALRATGRAALIWAVFSAVFGSACVISHHVSSFFCVAFLALILLTERARGRPGALRLAAVAVIPVAVVLALWTAFVAPSVISYLAPVYQDIEAALLHHRVSALPVPRAIPGLRLPRLRSSPVPTSSPSERYLEYLGTVALVLAYSAALVTWVRPGQRKAGRPPADGAFVLASLVLYVLVAVRVALPDGSELSSRLYAYALLPVSYVLVQGARRAFSSRAPVHAHPRPSFFRPAGASALAVVIWVGVLAAAWPPSYARLPGPPLAAAWERSTSPAVLAASEWAATHLSHHLYFVSDQMTASVFSGLADETAVSAPAAYIFLASTMSPSTVKLLDRYDISLIIVNRIVDQQLPADGKYFVDDPLDGYYASPIPLPDINKFLKWPGGSVIYDNSQVAIVAVAP